MSKLAGGMLAVLCIAGILWRFGPGDPLDPSHDARPTAFSRQDASPGQAGAHTVARAWDWHRFPHAEQQSARRASQGQPVQPFSAAGIHRALSQVRLDDYGQVRLDDTALHALRSTFAALDTTLTAEQLDEIQQIIRTGLPGQAGEDVARVVVDYYHYHLAMRDFDPVATTPDNLEQARRQHEELVALRHEQFGFETAERLFGTEQALTRFTLESMQIQSTPGLSQPEKDRMQVQLQASVPQDLLPSDPTTSPAWQRRYAAFAAEKERVVAAGLSEDEARAQIERLLSAHFDAEERERARDYIPVEETPEDGT